MRLPPARGFILFLHLAGRFPDGEESPNGKPCEDGHVDRDEGDFPVSQGIAILHPRPKAVHGAAIGNGVKETIAQITSESDEAINIAIKVCLYCMKSQIFLDGNKRSSVIFANHYLVSHAGGFLVIPKKNVPEFKRLLVKYYEDDEASTIAAFMKEHCWKPLNR